MRPLAGSPSTTPALTAHPIWAPLTIATVGILVIILAAAAMPAHLLVDETFHEGQVRYFLEFRNKLVPELPMLPGYHLLLAAISGLFRIDSLFGMRVASALVFIPGILAAWFHLRREDDRQPFLKSLQILACPLLWPFMVLVYTDTSTLAILLITLCVAAGNHQLTASLSAVASILLRQTSIAWILVMWLSGIHRDLMRLWSRHFSSGSLALSSTRRVLADLASVLRTNIWPMLAAGLFISFVLWNQGIAVGDREFHDVGGVYPTQIYFFFLVIWFVLLPLYVHNIPGIWRIARSKPWLVLGLALVILTLAWNFTITHHHNFGAPEFHLRNRILLWIDAEPWHALILCPLAIWACLSLATVSMKKVGHYWLYPITIGVLAITELVEQRYYIVPVVLFLLFREPIGVNTERLLLAWFALISSAIVAMVSTGTLFL